VHPNSAEVNVAAQENDPDSMLSCYRQLLALRNRSLALQAGSLELLSPRGLPFSVVVFRRRHGEGERAEAAEVFLNFSPREVKVELPALPDRIVFSTQRGRMEPTESRLTLRAYEGVVACQG
jgi:glycosidase